MKYFVQNKNANNWLSNWLYRFEIYDYGLKTRTYCFPERTELTTEVAEFSYSDFQKVIKYDN